MKKKKKQTSPVIGKQILVRQELSVQKLFSFATSVYELDIKSVQENPVSVSSLNSFKNLDQSQGGLSIQKEVSESLNVGTVEPFQKIPKKPSRKVES